MADKLPFYNSIGGKIIMIFSSLSAVSIITVTLIVINMSSSALKNLAFEKLEAVHKIKKSQIIDLFDKILCEITVESQNKVIGKALSSFMKYRNEMIIGPDNDFDMSSSGAAVTRKYDDICKDLNNSLSNFIDTHTYPDLLLICQKHGHVVYSWAKGDDLGTNLSAGKYSNTILAELWRKTRNADKPVLVDMKEYAPAHGAVMFVGAPIIQRGKRLGVLAFRIPVNRIDQIMNERTGQGETGETYLVGDDLLMRSNSRFENKPTVLTKKIDTIAGWAGKNNTSGRGIIKGYRGSNVLSVYSYFELKEKFDTTFEWSFVTEIDEAEINQPIYSLTSAIIIVALFVFIIMALAAVFLNRTLTKPLIILREIAEKISRGDLDARVKIKTNDEIGSLSSSFDTMTDNLQNAIQASTMENRMREGEILVNNEMQGTPELAELCDRTLVVLNQWLNIQIGAIYISDEKRTLKLTSGYAIRKDIAHTPSFIIGEGIAGQAAQQKKILIFNGIQDKSIKLAGNTFEVAPSTIIAVPLIFADNVKGVLELGFFTKIKKDDIDFLDRIAGNIAIAINTSQTSDQINSLLVQAQNQSKELQAQQEELQAANEELEEQTENLQKSEKTLRAQQKELKAANVQLKEKSEVMKNQKKKVELQNIYLESSKLEIKRNAEELALASKYKSEFLANMSHELRTPLNSLLLLARNLASNKTGNLSDSQVKSADTIYNSGMDLLILINEILDLSKVEAGRIELQIEKIAIRELAEKIRTNFAHLYEDKAVNFSVNVDPQAPEFIKTDSQRLDQIINNLLTNALKFTQKGEVSVSIGPIRSNTDLTDVGLHPDDYFAIRVKDTGIGISEDKQQAIFEAFQQADGSTSREYGGTGLGLSISKELTVLLGGEIQLHSKPEVGSTFTLIIPVILNKEPAATDATADAGFTDKTDHNADLPIPTGIQPLIDDDRDNIEKGDTILLIIEDDPNFVHLLMEQGHKKGFKCLAALNGEDGLACAEEYIPVAIILDIILPGMDGWLVLNALKNNSALRHIPVHIISGIESTVDVFNKGIVGYLTKPVSVEQLNEVLAKLDKIRTRKFSELLVVEDNTMLRQEITKLIGNDDVRITAAVSGKETLKLFKKKKFDCMILDIGLPDMTGFELLDKLKEMDGVEIPPIIVYTGQELTKDEGNFIQRYTDSIIVKGVRSKERLLDETSLFLHRAVGRMDSKKRKIITSLYEQDKAFADKTILLVDDDMRTSFAMCQILEERGMNVLIANDGQRALDMLDKEKKIDLVLMDIMMPGMDGYEITKKIRDQEIFWNLPVIVLTAKAMPEDKAKCMDAGASDYLTKPVEEGRLLSMMRIWLYR